MKKRAQNHLKKLKEKNTDHFLQAFLAAYISNPEDLDLQISLLGAMHQSGWKTNQFMPYMNDFGFESDTWSKRCIERLLNTFRGDPLATSSLLFADTKTIISKLRMSCPNFVYAHTWENQSRFYRLIFSKDWNLPGSSRNFANQCVEVAWDESREQPSEVHYTKVIMGKDYSSYLNGTCDCTFQCSAHATNSFWYSDNSQINLETLDVVKRAISIIPDWILND